MSIMSLFEKILRDLLSLKVKGNESNESSHSSENEDEERKENYINIPDIVKLDIRKAIGLSSNNKEHKPKKRRDKCNIQYTKELLQLEYDMFESIEIRCMSNVEVNGEILFVDEKKKLITCMICNVAISMNEFFICYEHLRSRNHTTRLENLNQEKDLFNFIKQFMITKTTECVKCMSCGTVVNNKNKIMHIDSSKHMSNSIKYIDNRRKYLNGFKKALNDALSNIQYYACSCCMEAFHFKIEFLDHLYKQHKYNTEPKENTFNFCVVCAMLWFEKGDVYRLHSTDSIHSYLLESKHFVVGCMPERAKNLLQSSDELAEKLLNEICDVKLNEKMISEVKSSLSTVLKPSYPQMEMYAFGSRIYGLGFKNSDIDIYIDCENKNYNAPKDQTTMKYLTKCKQLLQVDNKTWEIKKIITDCRVPIITVVHTKTGLLCDFSFSNGLSVETTSLIREYCKQKHCRKLLLFLKRWFRLCHFPRTLAHRTYALIWCAIFYLQTKGLLPTVAELIEEQKPCVKSIGVWKVCPFYNNIMIHQHGDQKFSDLLLGFFRYYESFDYRHCIICPLLGVSVKKEDFIYGKDFNANEMPNDFRIDSAMCVQDPYNLSENITQTIDPFAVNMFRQYCSQCARILTK